MEGWMDNKYAKEPRGDSASAAKTMQLVADEVNEAIGELDWLEPKSCPSGRTTGWGEYI